MTMAQTRTAPAGWAGAVVGGERSAVVENLGQALDTDATLVGFTACLLAPVRVALLGGHLGRSVAVRHANDNTRTARGVKR